ncbi:MAG: SDR family oxidoreductase [Granulosicoccus sp.]|nr:SDR family oxidoreductase [Granulosicoccus sp.]
MTSIASLDNKTAVITGAGRGIGQAIAKRFAQAGANIAICARTASELTETKAAVEENGKRCLSSSTDLSDPASTLDFCNKVIDRFGTIDILINNAGAYLERGTVAESEPDLWWKTIEVNVRGPYMMTRYLLHSMADGGKILNLSSGKGLSAGANSASYHVSKAGLHMLTENLANELWPRRIDVNNLIPGPVATTTFSREDPSLRTTPEALLEKYKHNLPAGLPEWERVKHPNEIAELALWIVSMPEGGPTGQTFSLARRPL